MKRYAILWLLSTFMVLSSHGWATDSEILIDDYRDGLSPKWEEKSFKGRTLYQVVRENKEFCIKATSLSSVSALYYRMGYDAREYPILTWCWRVKGVHIQGRRPEKSGR